MSGGSALLGSGARLAASAAWASAFVCLALHRDAVAAVRAPSGDATDDDQQEPALPPGHPEIGSRAAPGSPPHLLEDSSTVDPQLPPGTIVVEVRDRTDQPLAGAEVTLGFFRPSVGKGSSIPRSSGRADATGTARFEGLEASGAIVYRLSVASTGPGGAGGTREIDPFQLEMSHGQRVRVYVYPVTTRIQDALIAMQGLVYLELKDDALQLDELFQILNFGQTTWMPSDVFIDLPHGFRAFQTDGQTMSAAFDEVPGRGARLRGSVPPGQKETHFRFQIPYDGGESVGLSSALPPHVVHLRIMAEAARAMTLEVAGFPPATMDHNQTGQRVLVAERRLGEGDALVERLRITLSHIPGPGEGRFVALAMTASIMLTGPYLGHRRRLDRLRGGHGAASDPQNDSSRARSRLVQEIAALDGAHRAGILGPKAHARMRETLLDALGRLLALDEKQ